MSDKFLSGSAKGLGVDGSDVPKADAKDGAADGSCRQQSVSAPNSLLEEILKFVCIQQYDKPEEGATFEDGWEAATFGIVKYLRNLRRLMQEER